LKVNEGCNMKRINLKNPFVKRDLWSLKYYIACCAIVLSVYIYSMLVGWRFLNYGEGSRKKDKTRTSRIYHHK
jgi:NADH:ubiquinone oxidoreductase subunit B-like Fe-S oxidoreductase